MIGYVINFVLVLISAILICLLGLFTIYRSSYDKGSSKLGGYLLLFIGMSIIVLSCFFAPVVPL